MNLDEEQYINSLLNIDVLRFYLKETWLLINSVFHFAYKGVFKYFLCGI